MSVLDAHSTKNNSWTQTGSWLLCLSLIQKKKSPLLGEGFTDPVFFSNPASSLHNQRESHLVL